jgi:hypothetical protein
VFKGVHGTLIVTLAAAAGVTLLPPSLVPFGLTAVFIVSGAAVALSNLACTTHLFSFVPKEGRAFFLSFSNLMLAIGPAAALFITGTVLEGVGERRDIFLHGVHLDMFQVMLIAAGGIALLITPLLRKLLAATPSA